MSAHGSRADGEQAAVGGESVCLRHFAIEPAFQLPQTNSRIQPQKQSQHQEIEEELEEKEEPDRLTTLLQHSRFDCIKKNTGYYADEELQCEVFHYCQDGVKHSWICPSGFAFHQVHLICMPAGEGDICARSSQYHFVNEYLYRPLNQDEAARKPNVSLRYSDRYYPADIYRDDRYDDDDDDAHQNVKAQRAQQAHRAEQVQRAEQAQRAQHEQRAEQAQRAAQAHRAEQVQRAQQSLPSQAFRSASEVNIPLTARRPTAYLPLPSTPADFDYQ